MQDEEAGLGGLTSSVSETSDLRMPMFWRNMILGLKWNGQDENFLQGWTFSVYLWIYSIFVFVLAINIFSLFNVHMACKH